MKNKLLITFGCSWTYGIGLQYTHGMSKEEYVQTTLDYKIADAYSFRGIISKKFNYHNNNFSLGGSSNQRQFRKAKEYFSSNEFLKDKQKYDKIIVLWGITSLYRNEVYLTKKKKLENFFYTSVKRSFFSLKSNFLDDYFKNVFDEDNALRELSLEILFWDNFFNAHNIENYWFDTFNHHNYTIPVEHIADIKESYSDTAGSDWPSWQDYLDDNFNNIPQHVHNEINNEKKWEWARRKKDFPKFNNIIDYNITPRDLASYLAKNNGLQVTSTKPHLSNWQSDVDRISYLNKVGLVNPISFHPTIQAHEQIADYFINKIKF